VEVAPEEERPRREQPLRADHHRSGERKHEQGLSKAAEPAAQPCPSLRKEQEMLQRSYCLTRYSATKYSRCPRSSRLAIGASAGFTFSVDRPLAAGQRVCRRTRFLSGFSMIG
jgi:hypothetical protein